MVVEARGWSLSALLSLLLLTVTSCIRVVSVFSWAYAAVRQSIIIDAIILFMSMFKIGINIAVCCQTCVNCGAKVLISCQNVKWCRE